MGDTQRNAWSRRALLQTGTAGLAGLTLAGTSSAVRAEAPRKARRCILIMGVGGMSQLDTWDPKPEAPAEIRGPFHALDTRVPGLRVSEILPKLAAQAHRLAVIRSVHHSDAAVHETGLQLMQTGRIGHDLAWPHVGSVVAQASRSQYPLPAQVVLPFPLVDTGLPLRRGQDAGFLGRGLDPIFADGDPAAHDFSLAGMFDAPVPEPTLSCNPDEADRTQLRTALLTSHTVQAAPVALAGGDWHETSAARTAFDVSAEKPAARDRYGRNTFGQSCLLARRLVESGVGFVTVNQFDTLFHGATWDCHGFPDLPTRVADLAQEVAPQFDRAVATLIQDLAERGMLDDTLVCVFTEFGRTPRLTATGGRDHHSDCWSVMMAGGGIRSGVVVGASDAEGAMPAERPVKPAELLATVYHQLGIDTQSLLAAPDGKRHRLLPFGTEPIKELI